MKLESLVIADQDAAVNTFPGLVHTARQTMEAGNARSRWHNLLRGVSRLRRGRCLGLSRNKVSLRERGDGSPPFYGERIDKKIVDV